MRKVLSGSIPVRVLEVVQNLLNHAISAEEFRLLFIASNGYFNDNLHQRADRIKETHDEARELVRRPPEPLLSQEWWDYLFTEFDGWSDAYEIDEPAYGGMVVQCGHEAPQNLLSLEQMERMPPMATMARRTVKDIHLKPFRQFRNGRGEGMTIFAGKCPSCAKLYFYKGRW